MRLLVEALLRVDIGMGGTGDARFCVSTWLSPLSMMDIFMDDIRRPKSRDAKFCVSRGVICCYCQRIIEWVYWRW